MFDTVILLTSPAVRPIFASVLLAHHPSLAIVPVATLDDLREVEPGALARARLISCATGVVVPASVLDRLGYGAYNFHPGPPSYPGWAPAHFALHGRATQFGATAHVMVARVDEGPIVAVEMFPIPPGTSTPGLEAMAYARLSYLFWALARPLATSPDRLSELPVRWSGRKTTRRDYDAIREVPPDIQPGEVDHRIAVCGDDPNFGSRVTFREIA